MFAFSRDQCLTSGAPGTACKDILLISSPPMGPTMYLNSVSVEQPAAFWGCSVRAGVAGRPPRACVRASQPLHQSCREVSSFLVILSAAACSRHSGKASACVLRGRMQGGEQDGANGSSHPSSQDADRGPGGTDPTLKCCWLLPLQGLDHLLSPAEGEERTSLGLHLTAERRGRRTKLPSPFPTQQQKQVRHSPEAKTALSSVSQQDAGVWLR